MPSKLVSKTLLMVVLICFALPSWAVSKDDYTDALSAWSRVLNNFVTENGQIDFFALSQERDDLKTYIEFVAIISPANTPSLFETRADEIAYHINTYNALAMYGVIEEGIPDDFDCFFKRLIFFKLRKVEIGGLTTSLYDYENEIIRQLNEPRVHFVLNCMVKDCPRLPRKVFDAESLDQDLERLTREFLNSDKHVQLDTVNQRVYVSEILDFYTEDFIESGEQQDLLPYINQYRSVAIPSIYQLNFFDYDWTLNQQP